MKLFSLFTVIVFYVSFSAKAQFSENIQWSNNGNSYYEIENNNIVLYQLPSFHKTVIVDSTNLIPQGQEKAIKIRSFSFSGDTKKILIYTNTKKVWRRDTRGDYWVLNTDNNTIKQLGKGRPSSSLMFAKISPDGTKAAYVSEHNIYAEDIATNKITQLTNDGTARLINGTFDWAYEEEFDCRDGFRWSPDSKNIAYWQIDANK